jgi:hypothetical protein
MARIYYGSFFSITGVEYRVELWDAPSGSATGGDELTLAGDGLSIERQGESDSVYSNFIRPSRAITQWVMPDQTTLDDFIGIQTKAETAWAMLVYRNNTLFYVGRVLADQMTRLRESIQSKPIIDLVAVDGLELLDGFNVKSSWFSNGYITVNQLFRRCLDTLDLADYWVVNGTSNAYLYDGTLLHEASALRLGFDMYQINEYTFLENFDAFTDVKTIDIDGWQVDGNYITAKQALENVLLMFGARFTHENGAYYVIPFNAYNNTTSINLRQYSYTGQYIGTTTYSHRQTIGNDVRPLWMAKPSLYYQPAAQSVTINTHRQNIATEQRTYANRASTTLTMTINDIPTGSLPDSAPMRLRFLAKSNKLTTVSGGITYVEDATDLYYTVKLIDGLGNTMILDSNGYWVSGTPTPKFNRFQTRNVQSGWITASTELSVTTAPVGFDTLIVEMYVYGFLMAYTGTTKWKSQLYQLKDFWGSIQVAFADSSPYQNADYTFDVTETITASSANLVNSVPIEIDANYYVDSLKYGIGNWLVNNGTTNVLASDWYGGWDSITHGSITKMLGLQMASIYANFVPVVRGTWIDSGTLTAIKSLYFDNYAWVLNGSKWSARSEQWDGEWLGVSPVYTLTTSGGEGLKTSQSPTNNLLNRLNYIESSVNNINVEISETPQQVLEYLVNEADGAPTSQPTLNTRWEVMLNYNDGTEEVKWHIQEHNAPVTYTAGTHTITNGYELILCDTSGGAVNVDLPDPTLSKGKKYYFKKTTTSHQVVITGGGYDIDGSPSKVLTNQFETVTVISDGMQWWLIVK